MKRLFIATCAHEPDEFILADDIDQARKLLEDYLSQFGWNNSDDWDLEQHDYITHGH